MRQAARREMTARFQSRCRGCPEPIYPNENIVYEPGVGAWHKVCAPAPEPEPEPDPEAVPTAGGLPIRVADTEHRCDDRKCRTHIVRAGEEYVVEWPFGINARMPRFFHPACYERLVRARHYAQECERARAIGFASPRALAAARRQWAEEAEQRRERGYWERVDNYRELGHDPN